MEFQFFSESPKSWQIELLVPDSEVPKLNHTAARQQNTQEEILYADWWPHKVYIISESLTHFQFTSITSFNPERGTWV